MNHKTTMSLLHDINAVFDSVIYELCSSKKDWIEIHLAENITITACDFPHLLTIARNYRVTISIYPVKLNQLAVFFKEIE